EPQPSCVWRIADSGELSNSPHTGRSRTAGADPAAGGEERAADDAARGSLAPLPLDYGIGGQQSRRRIALAYACRRHYGGPSQNSRLFAAFGVFSRHRLSTAAVSAKSRRCGVGEIREAAC